MNTRTSKRKYKREHNNSHFIMKTALTQAKAQTQATSTRIKMPPFPYACTYAYAATSENEISLRNNTSIRIFTTPGMFGQWKYWIQITSRLNSLEGSDDFARSCVCVCACAWVATKTRLKKREQKIKKCSQMLTISKVPVCYKSALYCYKSALLLQKCPIVTKVPYRELQKCPNDVTKVP